MKRFRTGVVAGKFYPPHKGHHFLIETASSQCEKLFVLVCWKPEQTVPIGVRISGISEIHPEVTVIAVEDSLADDDTPGWAAYTIQVLGQSPEAVFTSEEYGEGYARAMGAQHVMVDRQRSTVPCSGILVRSNPLEHLGFMSPPVRAFYIKRVCIVGAESTGKTTLAEQLAKHYQTVLVPEFGREYCAEKWAEGNISSAWKSEEFITITREQERREDQAARVANKLLICDTDPFATSIWHERYLNSRCREVEEIAKNRHYDLYILTGDEIPFVQDGLRDGEHIRHWMHKRFETALTATKRPWVLVSGSLPERFLTAVGQIDRLLYSVPSEKSS